MLSGCLSVCQTIFSVTVHLSVCQSVCPSVCQSVCQSVGLSIFQCVSSSVCFLSVCQSVSGLINFTRIEIKKDSRRSALHCVKQFSFYAKKSFLLNFFFYLKFFKICNLSISGLTLQKEYQANELGRFIFPILYSEELLKMFMARIFYKLILY